MCSLLKACRSARSPGDLAFHATRWPVTRPATTCRGTSDAHLDRPSLNRFTTTLSSLKNPRDPHKHWWLGVSRIPGTPSLLSNDGCFLGVLLPCSPAPPPMTSSVPALTR